MWDFGHAFTLDFEINLIALISMVLLMCKTTKSNYSLLSSKFFVHLLANVSLLIVLETISEFMVNGFIPLYRSVHVKLLLVYSLVQASLPATLLIYILQVNHVQLTKTKAVFLLIPTIANYILIIINYFHSFLYYFTNDGIYHKGPYFFVIGLLSFLYLLNGFALTIKLSISYDERTKTSGKYLTIFASLVTVSLVISNLFLNVSYFPLLSLCILFLYINVQSKNTEELNILAYRDSLTKLRNSTAYQYEISTQDYNIENHMAEFAIILFDTNGLKYFNDNFGHDTGNELIKACSSYICRIFSHCPVYRIGGDEFIVFIKGGEYEKRKKLLEAFDSNLSFQSFTYKGNTHSLSIARGFADYEEGSDKNYADVFSRADREMYINKKNSKLHR